MSEQLGVVGLGRMGGGLARHALSSGMRVVGYAPEGASDELTQAGLVAAHSLKELVERLQPPRVVLIYVPAGSPVDEVIDVLAPSLGADDIVVDGGNSYWRDSAARARRLSTTGIHLVDLGTSGGVEGARNGACFMAGGDPGAVARLESILRPLAVPGGWVNAGPSGAGHFVKLVHNGIEFAMLQAIGEGMGLLEGYPDPLPIADVLTCWRHGSVIRGWLVDLMERGYRDLDGLGSVPDYVEDTGEVNWLVADALEFEASIPVIAQSVMQLFESRDDRRTWARSIAVMRRGFGGHPLGADPAIARERRVGRLSTR